MKERELYELRTQFYDRIRATQGKAAARVYQKATTPQRQSSLPVMSQQEPVFKKNDISMFPPPKLDTSSISVHVSLPTPTSPLLQFDCSILDQLDAIMEEQQRVLQALGVPGFFVTKEPKLVERQRVVVEVMRGVGHHPSVRSS